jgi:hypothetical protein
LIKIYAFKLILIGVLNVQRCKKKVNNISKEKINTFIIKNEELLFYENLLFPIK